MAGVLDDPVEDSKSAQFFGEDSRVFRSNEAMCGGEYRPDHAAIFPKASLGRFLQ